MKKFFLYNLLLTTAILGLSGTAAAQHYGDTLQLPPPTYGCNPLNNLDTASNPHMYSMHGDGLAFYTDYGLQNSDSINYNSLSDHFRGNVIIGNQLVTDRPIKIVGIAACALMQAPSDTTTSIWLSMLENLRTTLPGHVILNTRDTSRYNRITDSMILYKPTPNGLVLLNSAPWRIEQPHRYMALPPKLFNHHNPATIISLFSSRGRAYHSLPSMSPEEIWQFIDSTMVVDPSPVASLYETMFDKPIVVEDSFVVAGTELNNEGSYGWVTLPALENTGYREWMWLWDHNPTRYWTLESFVPLSYADTSLNMVSWRKFRHDEWLRFQTNGWYHADYIPDSTAIDTALRLCGRLVRTYLIYPIIDIDFDTLIEHCLPVENIRVAATTDTSATLIWDAANSQHWEVRYGILGMDWEDYFSISTATPTATLTRLNTGVQYRVFVRGWCQCDSSWGEWAEGNRITLQRQEGIADPGNLGRFTQLLPNPARDVVNVLSSYKMNRIAVYDLSGRKLLEQAADGISAIVDISTLPSGTYITAIYLPHGVATKKLLVE